MGEDMLKIGIFSCSHLFDFVSMALLKLFKRVSCYILLNEGVSIGNCYKFHLFVLVFNRYPLFAHIQILLYFKKRDQKNTFKTIYFKKISKKLLF